MGTALITGITGQDGSYLAGHLVALGWKVLGTTRSLCDQQVKLHIPGVTLVHWDMHDSNAIASALSLHKPNAIYNLAARSSGAGMFDEPVEICEDNGIAVARLLEAIRIVDPAIRLCQASSSEMFGHVQHEMQTEDTVFHPRSPYGAAKLYAHTMIDIYRRHHGLFACSAILYNHESPRRSEDFVTGKIAHGAARVSLGLADVVTLGNIEAQRDWGYAPDYVEAMHLMLEHAVADDYVIATGKTHSVREFCDIAFSHLGLDYRKYIIVALGGQDRAPETRLCGDASKARRILGWMPRTQFEDMVRLMVDDALRCYAKTDSAQIGRDSDAR